MLRLLLPTLFLFFALTAHAQTAVTVKGRVLDAQTRQPVPYALIGVGGNQLGTSANEEGRFSLNIPPQYQQLALEVSFIGYRKATVALPVPAGQEVQVLLTPTPTQLANVTVSGSALGIVRAAVARIPRNYPSRPTELTGFYRESSNVPGGRYQYLAEGVLKVRKLSYRTPRETGDVQLVQSRKYEAHDSSRMQMLWQAGPLIPHRFDFVHSRADFLHKAHYAEYDYQIADATTFNGRPVYAISFTPRSAKADYTGRLYIDLDTYAILGADFSLTPGGVKRYQGRFGAIIGYYDTRIRHVSYQRYAGRWHLKRVWDQAARTTPGRAYQHTSEFITTAIDTAQAARPDYVDRFQFEDVFLRNSVRYDSTFWQNYTSLVLPKQVAQQLLDEERQRKAEQLFSDSTAAARRPRPVADTAAAVARPDSATPPAPSRSHELRLRFSLNVEAVPLAIAPGELQVSYAPTGSGFAPTVSSTIRPRQLSALAGGSYQLGIGDQWIVRYTYGTLRGELRGGLNSWGLLYRHNLSKRHRPFHLRAALDFSTLRIRQRLGRFDNPDADLRIAGTHLNADRLALGLQTRTRGFQPRLGVELELSPSYVLLLEGSYWLWPHTRQELLVEEKKGFFLFRQEATVSTSAPEVQVQLNGQPVWEQLLVPQRFGVRLGLQFGTFR